MAAVNAAIAIVVAIDAGVEAVDAGVELVMRTHRCQSASQGFETGRSLYSQGKQAVRLAAGPKAIHRSPSET
jgi:hypothetical protein